MTNIYPLFLCAFVVLFLSEFSDAKGKCIRVKVTENLVVTENSTKINIFKV